MRTLRIFAVVTAMQVLWNSGVLAQDIPKPDPEHEILKQMEGNWDAQVKYYMPSSETPLESKGESTAKMDVGGFFLVSEFKSQMEGMAYHGRGISGYDPAKKKYVGVWVDSMSPVINVTEGTFDKSTNVFTETMEGVDPKGKTMKFRMTTKIEDKDHMLFKIFALGVDGKENLMEEIAYTRKK